METSASKDNSINPDHVETLVDSCRLSADWEGVMNGLKRYAHIFDIGAASSTNQHPNLDAVRAYYWACMGEAVLEKHYDYYNAIESAKRALEIDSTCIDARILIGRILLATTLGLFRPDKVKPHVVFTRAIEDLKVDEVLAGPLASFAKTEQKVLSGVVGFLDHAASNSVLAALSLLSAVEVFAICDLIISRSKALSPSPGNKEILAKTLVLAAARGILRVVNLEEITAKYVTNGISEYRMWMYLDAVAARLAINEALHDYTAAGADAMHILTNIVLPPNDTNFSSIPEVCRNVALYTACRLPLIEMSCGRTEAALDAFHRCIAEGGSLVHLIPIPLNLGMSVEASVLILVNAMKSGGGATSVDAEGNAVLEYEHAPEAVCTDLDDAYVLLTGAYNTMTMKVNAESIAGSSKLSASSIDPIERSLQLTVPQSPSDPAKLIESASSSTIGSLLSTLAKVRETTFAARAKSIEILEWGIALEIKPRPNLMWLLAGAYCDAGRWDHATELLQQCHFSLAMKQSEDRAAEGNNPNNNRNVKSLKKNIDETVAELLVWLGVGRSPALPSWRWLPLAMASEIALDHTIAPKDGRQFAYRGLVEVYGVKGAEVVKALGSDASMVVSQEEFEVLGVSIKDKYRNGESSLHTTATLGLGSVVERGFLVFLLLLGRSHAALARQPEVRDFSRTRHFRVATKTFDLILRAIATTRQHVPAGLEEEVYLNQCVVLGELGEISAAVAIARKALSLPKLEESSRLLHLLALLLAALGDDPQSMGAATILCKRASEINPTAISAVRGAPSLWSGDGGGDLEDTDGGVEGGGGGGYHALAAGLLLGNSASQSPNARLSLALLEWHAGDKESALRSIDQIVTSALAVFRSVTERQHRIRDAVIAAHTTGATTTNHAPIKTAAGEDDGLTKEILTATTLKEYAAACKKPVGLISTDNPLTVRLLVDILLTCSRFYRTGGKFIKARSSLEDAWRVLFTPTSDTLTEVADLLLESTGPPSSDKRGGVGAGGGGGGGKGRNSGVGLISGPPALGDNVDEFKRIDIMRRVPTLTGWRMSEASGWGVSTYPDLQASVLCEAALQTENTDIAVQLLQFAVSLYPEHMPSLVALADLELARIENSAIERKAAPSADSTPSESSSSPQLFSKIAQPTEGSSAGEAKKLEPLTRETKAYEFAIAAVRARDLSPEGWYILGRVYQTLGQADAAADALTTALECMRYSPLRDFSTVLSDPLLTIAQRRSSTVSIV